MINFNSNGNPSTIKFNGEDVKLIRFRANRQEGDGDGPVIWAKPCGVLHTTVNGTDVSLSKIAYRTRTDEPNAFIGYIVTGSGGTPIYYNDTIEFYGGYDPNYPYYIQSDTLLAIDGYTYSPIKSLTANIPPILYIKGFTHAIRGDMEYLTLQLYANQTFSKNWDFYIYDMYEQNYVTYFSKNLTTTSEIIYSKNLQKYDSDMTSYVIRIYAPNAAGDSDYKTFSVSNLNVSTGGGLTQEQQRAILNEQSYTSITF